MIKIVYLTDQVYLHGGVEKVLSQKLNYLSKIPNFEVHLITTEQKGKGYCYPISDKVIHHDLGVNYKRTKSYFSPVNFKKIPIHIKRLKDNLSEINPDVLIVCNYAFDFYFIPFISKGIKTIKEYHTSRYNYRATFNNASLFKKVLFKLNAIIEKKYRYLVVLNNDEQQHFKGSNIIVIPNKIAIKTTKNTIARKNIILAAGRIAPVKQFDHLIKAWGLIADRFPDWEVHIYGDGDGSLINELKVLIKQLGTPTVKLIGATNNLEKKMKEASIFTLTSETECFPMVLLESLACGLPVVSYNCPYGPSNIITNGKDGVLVQYNNIEAFSVALAHLIENSEKRKVMEQAALNNIERFNENKVMQQWVQLFNKKEK